MPNYLDIYGKDSAYAHSFRGHYVLEEINVPSSFRRGELLGKHQVHALFSRISLDAKRKNFYVGITCDPERREDEHDAKFLAVVDSPCVEDANNLERELSVIGFDAGKHIANAHNKNSTKLYIYKKSEDTEQ